MRSQFQACIPNILCGSVVSGLVRNYFRVSIDIISTITVGVCCRDNNTIDDWRYIVYVVRYVLKRSTVTHYGSTDIASFLK